MRCNYKFNPVLSLAVETFIESHKNIWQVFNWTE